MVKTVLILFGYAISSAVGLSLIKMVMNKNETGGQFYYTLYLMDWRFWIGALLYGIGFVVWLILLKLNDLSAIFPSAAGSLVISTTILGHYYLGETITIKIISGIILIIFGIYLVTSK